MKTIKTFAIIIVFLTFFTDIFAQKDYFDISTNQKTNVFDEEFDNNNNSWPVGDDESSVVSVESGYLFLKSKNDQAQLVFKSIDKLDENNNFEIEAAIKWVKGSETSGLGLLWGKGGDNDYGLYFTPKGSFKIAKYDEGYVNFIDFTNTDAISKYGFNKITIRKYGSTLYFFINEKYVYDMPFQKFFGPKIGFQSGANGVIHVDYLRVYSLSGKTKNVNTNVNNNSNGQDEPKRINDNGTKTNNNNNNNTSSFDPTVYSNIKSASLSTVFYDDFSNNDNSWGVGETDDIFREITDGHYTFKTKVEKYYSTWKTIDEFNDTRNFELETKIKWVAGSDNYENCFIWGADDSNSYRFGFTGSGYYCIYKMSPGVVDYVDYTKSDKVYSTYNKLTVRKYKNTIYFFLNENLMYQRSFEEFFGKKFGFLVAKSATIWIDYMKLSYIN